MTDEPASTAEPEEQAPIAQTPTPEPGTEAEAAVEQLSAPQSAPLEVTELAAVEGVTDPLPAAELPCALDETAQAPEIPPEPTPVESEPQPGATLPPTIPAPEVTAEVSAEAEIPPEPERVPQPVPEPALTPVAEVAPGPVAEELVKELPAEAPQPPAETEVQPEPAPATPKPARKPRAKSAQPATSAVAASGEGAVAVAEAPESTAESKKKWYVVKVQSGREESIKAAIERKVKIEGLEEFFGEIVIPVEEVVEKKKVKVKDKKTGEVTYQEKNVTMKKKKFHGYLFANVEFNDRILYLFRETGGVGDFVGVRGTPPRPDPMPDDEVQAMLTGVAGPKGRDQKKVKVKLDFEKGDKVRIREGAFANNEGEVKAITEPKDPTDSPKVTVVVTIWGRPVDVELEYWQVDKA